MSGKPLATKRLRFATQRHPGAAGPRKRDTIMRALSIRRRTPEKNDADLEQVRENFETNQQQDGRGVVFDIDNEEELSQRRVYVNQHLPAELLDEDGSPLQQFSRNKIRTAKYTPLIFVPKNLWLQFHNIANIYFLFVTILAVRLL
jgi:phospholipid-translocating ATPase